MVLKDKLHRWHNDAASGLHMAHGYIDMKNHICHKTKYTYNLTVSVYFMGETFEIQF